jgi:hypothetical protein
MPEGNDRENETIIALERYSETGLTQLTSIDLSVIKGEALVRAWLGEKRGR